MRVHVARERSGLVRSAFAMKGWDAWSCDLEPSAIPGQHHQCDIFEVLYDDWDLLIAHPECTYLSSSGLHWNRKRPERNLFTEEAIEFAERLWNAKIPHKALENPIGCLSTRSAIHESAGLQYLHQIKGPARGVFQMEPTTHRDLIKIYGMQRPEKIELLYKFKPIILNGLEALHSCLAYQIAACRLQYWRQPIKLPHHTDEDGLWLYYKQFWNSKKGKATREGYDHSWEMWGD